MSKEDSEHEQLVKCGLRLHEDFRYCEALRFFRKALRVAPDCPAAIYNLANTLFMLGRDQEAHALLTRLLRMNEAELRDGCHVLRQPVSFQTDALYLMFHVLVQWKRSWSKAFPYAKRHLRYRRRGIKSAWSARTIRREIVELKEALHKP